jgi:hypothetical protein
VIIPPEIRRLIWKCGCREKLLDNQINFLINVRDLSNMQYEIAFVVKLSITYFKWDNKPRRLVEAKSIHAFLAFLFCSMGCIF